MAGSMFEVSLSQIADAKLNQDAPSLSNYKIGFQLIDKNDDETKGFGVMVYKIGETWAYVPIFYSGGVVKGTDLMYLQQQGIFVPCKESWLSYIKSRQSVKLGSAATSKEKDKADQGRSGAANILGQETRIIKTAAYVGTEELYNLLDLPTYKDFEGFADLRKWVPRLGKQAAVTLLSLLNDNADFANAFLEKYSLEDLNRMVKAAEEIKLEESKPAVVHEIKIITPESPEAKELKDSEKEALIKDNIFIIDNRKITSTVFRNNLYDKLSSITKPGYYSVLMADGKYKYFYAVKPMIEDGSKNSKDYFNPIGLGRLFLIPASGDKAYAISSSLNILAQPVENIDLDFTAIGSPISTLFHGVVNDSYLIFDSKGNALSIELDNSSVKAEDYMVVRDYNSLCDNYDITLKRTDHNGKLYRSGSVYYIPANARFVKLLRYYDAKDRFADASILTALLKEKTNVIALKVYSDGRQFNISSDLATSPMLDKTAALKELVLKYNIDAATAKHMIKDAAAKNMPYADRYLVKLAYVVPAEMESVIGNTAPNEVTEEIVGARLADEDKRLLDAAVESGYSDIMDVSVLKILASSSGVIDQLNEYIPDLIRAVDRLGRLLFLLYWQVDVFKERYGNSNLVELEDLLKKVFNGLSDLVLFLHKKSISSKSVLDSSIEDISSNLGL